MNIQHGVRVLAFKKVGRGGENGPSLPRVYGVRKFVVILWPPLRKWMGHAGASDSVMCSALFPSHMTSETLARTHTTYNQHARLRHTG